MKNFSMKFLLLLQVSFISFTLNAETFKLPFPEGKSYNITQCGSAYGTSNNYSHVGKMKYAWDFGMGKGNELSAIADGIVTHAVDSYWQSGGEEYRIRVIE